MMMRLRGTPSSQSSMRSMIRLSRVLLAARESGAGSIVGEGHGLAGGHPAADHAAGQSDEERRQGAESAVTRDDGGLKVAGNAERDPGWAACQTSVPHTELAPGHQRGA